jgi:hypothetical protein
MKRVYTDPRFPSYEIHNPGDNRFTVYERQDDGRLLEVDSFLSYAPHTLGKRDPNYRVSDEVATIRARSYFDRMAKGQMNDELADRQSEAPADPVRSHEPRPAPGKNMSLDDLMGTNVLSADDVMSAYEQAKGITDPVQRERAMQQVKQMSSRLESSADELVRRLID